MTPNTPADPKRFNGALVALRLASIVCRRKGQFESANYYSELAEDLQSTESSDRVHFPRKGIVSW